MKPGHIRQSIAGGLFRFTTVCALLAAAGVLLSCSPSLAQNSLSSSNGMATQPTMVSPIGTGDMIHIDVVGEPDLSRDYQVDGNGDITMLYVGKSHLGGLTPDEATQKVTAALATIYVSPQVTLTRSSVGGSNVTITGDVQHQGNQVVRRDAHLNDVVQEATPQSDADLSKIQITRGLPGDQHSNLICDLSAFLSNGTASNNPPLMDGDVIFVPSKAPVTYSVSVVGAVVTPKRFDVQPGTTAYDLIKMAGGLTTDADRASIYIQPSGSLDRVPFNYDFARTSPQSGDVNPVLKDGDKIVIPEEATVPVFSITGAVLKPGQYALQGKLSLTDAEGLAGGLMPHAKVKEVQITRQGASGAQVIKLDISDANVPANFLLQPGDNVYIPEGSSSPRSDPLNLLGLIIGVAGILK